MGDILSKKEIDALLSGFAYDGEASQDTSEKPPENDYRGRDLNPVSEIYRELAKYHEPNPMLSARDYREIISGAWEFFKDIRRARRAYKQRKRNKYGIFHVMKDPDHSGTYISEFSYFGCILNTGINDPLTNFWYKYGGVGSEMIKRWFRRDYLPEEYERFHGSGSEE